MKIKELKNLFAESIRNLNINYNESKVGQSTFLNFSKSTNFRSAILNIENLGYSAYEDILKLIQAGILCEKGLLY